MLRVNIVGLRDLEGRFAAMRDVGLREIQLQEAVAVARTIKDVYRTRAPKSRGRSQGDEGREHFSESFTGTAQTAGVGFAVELVTSQPVLRGWLKHGTAPHLIAPKNKKALFWPGAAHPVRYVEHPGTQANPWEDEAEAEVMPVVVSLGNRIGVRVVAGLAGGV